MAANDLDNHRHSTNSDIILYQRISGGWEYRYTSDSETYTAFAYDAGLAICPRLWTWSWVAHH